MKYIDFKEPILSLNSPYWRIQKIGYLCLLILLVAAFIGLTGNGILGTTIKTDPAGVLKVEYDPVLRAHADTLITLWINPKNLAQTPSLTISLSQATFANALIKQINPKPTSESVAGANILYTFSVSDYTSHMPIQIWFEPQMFGLLNTNINIQNQANVTFKQLILP